MGVIVVAGVEVSVDFGSASGGGPGLRVRTLGALAILRGGVAQPMPASRKVRGLFAYLALAARPVTRSHLCELLWDLPGDPRGELRWCLSKMRGMLDSPERRRVIARDDAVELDLAGCVVDALEVQAATAEGFGTLAPQRLLALSALFEGDFLDGMQIERSPAFDGWLAAQRRRFRACEVALLDQLARVVPEAQALVHLERWRQLAPFDRRVHEMLLAALARCGRIREGEDHLASTVRLFESEGLDGAPLRQAWRAARARESEPIEVRLAPSVPGATDDRVEAPAPDPRRASIAVMPFTDRSDDASDRGGLADALAYDVIARLARLRSLFVIAQGTVFALHDRRIGAEEAGRMLNVDYIVSGSVRRRGGRLSVSVELAETRSARVVWMESFDHAADGALQVLEEIGNRIVASVSSEIEAVERSRAILQPPESLDAWEAHHRGLWHMYRFSKADNEQARHFFSMAVRLDPSFARAHAGLSFTHFQDAFQGWAGREEHAALAMQAAGQALMADDRDPAAHWAMGRALWLRGGHDPSVAELERSIDISPNFALGHYTLAFVQSQAGDPAAAIASSDYSRHLSPFDPLLFGMLGSRAMALVRLGRFAEGADWAMKAAARPNAHAHIFGIATFSLSLAGALDEARAHAGELRRMAPGYGVDDFLSAFQFDEDGKALFREGARRIGMG